MFARIAVGAALGLALLVVFGCDGGGKDFYKEPGGSGGGATLDLAGDYDVVPTTFFQCIAIYQSGNNLTAEDSRGANWTGQITGITMEETTGTGGTTSVTWKGTVELTGTIAGDQLSLNGVAEYQTTGTADVVIINATYRNESIGQIDTVVLTRVSRIPGTTCGAGGGGPGGENP